MEEKEVGGEKLCATVDQSEKVLATGRSHVAGVHRRQQENGGGGGDKMCPGVSMLIVASI